jgi:hypothetical protein
MSDEVNNESVENSADQSTNSTEIETKVNWKNSISEDIRSDEILNNVNSLDDLAKGYVHAQRTIGGMVRIPGEDAGTDQLNEFYSKLEKIPGVVRFDAENPDSILSKLGKPESSDKYEIKLDIDENLWDNSQLDSFKGVAHEAGLTNKQLNKLLEFEKARIDQGVLNTEEVKSTAEKTLRDQWGSDYSARMEGAKAAFNVYAEKFPEHADSLINGPAGNNPAFLSMLSELGGILQEKGHPNLQSKGSYGMTPQDALAQIDEIMGNPAHPYHDRSQPELRQRAVEKINALYNIAYPDEV